MGRNFNEFLVLPLSPLVGPPSRLHGGRMPALQRLRGQEDTQVLMRASHFACARRGIFRGDQKLMPRPVVAVKLLVLLPSGGRAM